MTTSTPTVPPDLTRLSTISDPRQAKLLHGLLDVGSSVAVAMGEDDVVTRGNDTFLRLIGATRTDLNDGRILLPRLVVGWEAMRTQLGEDGASQQNVVLQYGGSS